MSDVVLTFDDVHKKFKRGEIHDSLRDLLPALTGRFLRRTGNLESREFWALKEISFEITRGEAFGIVGHNGAGKSTILKLLSGIMRPTKGTIDVNGSLSALIEVGAGFHPDLTGRENIYLNGTILGMARREIELRFDEIVEFSGLSDFIDTPVKRYSSGMYARLGFAVAAHVDAEILVVDEVLSVGDHMFQKKCLDRMNTVIQNGTTVVFVSHNLQAVADLCGRSLLLDRGQMMSIGPIEEVIQSYMGLSYASRNREGHKARIVSVSLRGEDGANMRFDSGERAWIDVELEGLADCEGLAVVLDMLDRSGYNVFNTSTERLGEEPFSLRSGSTYSCSFQLDLNLANGAYDIEITVYNYGTEYVFDTMNPAATVYVNTGVEVRGVANCKPKVTVRHGAAPASPMETPGA